jgi:hypothetical protein
MQEGGFMAWIAMEMLPLVRGSWTIIITIINHRRHLAGPATCHSSPSHNLHLTIVSPTSTPIHLFLSIPPPPLLICRHLPASDHPPPDHGFVLRPRQLEASGPQDCAPVIFRPLSPPCASIHLPVASGDGACGKTSLLNVFTRG